MQFYQIFNRNGTCLWWGYSSYPEDVWDSYRNEASVPETISNDQLQEGRYGLRLVSWPE